MDSAVAQIIKARGGPEQFGRPLKASAATVRIWKVRKKFPRSRWAEILEAYPDLTLDELKAVEAAAA
jgi:hypothetical protein